MSQHDERSAQPTLDGVVHWLIHRAARGAPESLSARLEEEWLADLESRSSILSRLRFALGCCWATVVIVSDYPRRRVAATSAATATSAAAATSSAAAMRGFNSLNDRDFSYFSLRSGTLFLIAGLHAALFYGLITTLSHMNVLKTPSNLENVVVKPAPQEKLPLLPPAVTLKGWTIDVKKIEVDVPPKVDVENELTTEVEKSLDTHTTPLPPEPPAHVVRQVAGGPGAGFPETADYYPMLSIHLGEQGVSTVRVCVDPRGRLTTAPSIVKGSGSARLDDGALKLARAGSGKYKATTEDGQAVNSCYAFGVRFQLK
jgi:TonB family protein